MKFVVLLEFQARHTHHSIRRFWHPYGFVLFLNIPSSFLPAFPLRALSPIAFSLSYFTLGSYIFVLLYHQYRTKSDN
jgi:hypothetical protein